MMTFVGRTRTALALRRQYKVDTIVARFIIAYANMIATAPTSRVDLVFRAFSDRTRLRILSMLRGGELCVCDLIAVLGVPQAKVSRHLAYLRRAGLVKARKDGLWHYYTLTPAKGAFHTKLLECLACCFSDVPELAKDAAKLDKQVKCGTGCC